jgi:DNA sulfur modification protein DndC
MLTGVRVGESAQRDSRIALSCGKNGAECGQGWFQETTPAAVADTLAPLLHWRVCHVWDWLTFMAPTHGLPTALVAQVYGGDEAEELNARTGCIGCPLATKDAALDYVLSLGNGPISRPEAPTAAVRGATPVQASEAERRRTLKDGSFSATPAARGR